MESVWEEIKRQREWMEEKLANLVASFFGYKLISQTSALGDGDQVDTSDNAVDPGTQQKSQRPVTRISPFGLAWNPPTGLRALWLSLGASNVVFLGIAPQQKYGPQNLNPGEIALYNITAALLKLLKGGGIAINSDTSQTPPGEVVVNNGTAAVARAGDNLTASSALATWAQAVETAINALAPGTFTPANNFAGNVAGVGILGSIHSGAPHFKA